MRNCRNWFVVVLLTLSASWVRAGDLTIQGNLSVSSNLTAKSLVGDGSNLTNLVSGLVKASLYGRTEDTLTNLCATTNMIDLLIDGGVWNITNSFDIPANVGLTFAADSMFVLSTGITLNIYGTMSAPPRQIVDGDVSGFVWRYRVRPTYIPVEWIGVKAEESKYIEGTSTPAPPTSYSQATQNTVRINAYIGKSYRGLKFNIGFYYVTDTITMGPASIISGAEDEGLTGPQRTCIAATPNFPLNDPNKPMISASLSNSSADDKILNMVIDGSSRAYGGIYLSNSEENEGVVDVNINGCLRRGIELNSGLASNGNGGVAGIQNCIIDQVQILCSPNSTTFIGIAFRNPISREVVRNCTILAGTTNNYNMSWTSLAALSNAMATATDAYDFLYSNYESNALAKSVFPTVGFYGIVVSGLTGGSLAIEDFHVEGMNCGILNMSQDTLVVKNYTASTTYCDLFQDDPPQYLGAQTAGITIIAMSGAPPTAYPAYPTAPSYLFYDKITGYSRIKPGADYERFSIPFYASDQRTHKYYSVDQMSVDNFSVGGGTAFSRMQAGTITLGTNGTSLGVYTTSFQTVFSTVPKITCTVRQDVSTNDGAMFMTTIRSINPTNFVLKVRRGDTNSGWNTTNYVDWFAWE